jgi:hypothetical protein
VVHLGLIGAGPGWEGTYRPALERLAGRIQIETLHTPTAREGVELAAQFKAVPRSGVQALLSRKWLNGVVAIDPGWYGMFPLAAAVEAGIPAYIAFAAPPEAARLEPVHRQATEHGVLAMPELRLRYMPSTLRLRELAATQLGPVQSIAVRSRSDKLSHTPWIEAQWADWCRTVVGSGPKSVESRRAAGPGGTPIVETTLTFTVAGSTSIRANLRLAEGGEPVPAVPADEWPLEFAVECKYGEAHIEDAVHLRWRSGGLEHAESLAADRTAVAVALDHFARRLAGGLVPTPDLGDVLAALSIAGQAEASRWRSGEPVA